MLRICQNGFRASSFWNETRESLFLRLFERRIETSAYIRTPLGQTRIPSVHTKTLAVAI